MNTEIEKYLKIGEKAAKEIADSGSYCTNDISTDKKIGVVLYNSFSCLNLDEYFEGECELLEDVFNSTKKIMSITDLGATIQPSYVFNGHLTHVSAESFKDLNMLLYEIEFKKVPKYDIFVYSILGYSKFFIIRYGKSLK